MAVRSETSQAAHGGAPDARPLHERIRADILSLNLPPGSDLDEKTLAARYGVSRTPVREAFIRLSASGLVEFSPSRGARVSSLILPNLPRYLESVDLMQRALAHLGALRVLPADAEKLAGALDALEQAETRLAPEDYPTAVAIADAEAQALRAIGECAHNAYLFGAYAKLLVQGQRMLRLPFAYTPAGAPPAPDYAAARIRALRAGETAIAARDGPQAEAALCRFHAAFTDRLTAYMAENLTGAVPVVPEDQP